MIPIPHVPAATRYDDMPYRRLGRSGLKLPAISLGLWHNFGDDTPHATKKAMLRTAFDAGITHFDLANNYGPPYGAAETAFGRLFAEDFRPYRDELILSSKAGWDMWPGPYGNWGSRKYLIASLDQSLQRMGVDYVDIFYHHRPDPDTPLEETMLALDQIVRSGKALYVGVSSYNAAQTRAAHAILSELKTPFVIHQPSYSMLNRWVEEDGLLDTLDELGLGSIVFTPLQQGLLTGKYLKGIPEGSRATQGKSLASDQLDAAMVARLNGLNDIAAERGQSLAQMAVAWVLRGERVTSALIGASRPEQVTDCVAAIRNLDFDDTELARIDALLAG